MLSELLHVCVITVKVPDSYQPSYCPPFNSARLRSLCRRRSSSCCGVRPCKIGPSSSRRAEVALPLSESDTRGVPLAVKLTSPASKAASHREDRSRPL